MLVIYSDGDDHTAWGAIPEMLNENDPRKAAEQIEANYSGGWVPFQHPDLRFDAKRMVLTFRGDPPMVPIGAIPFRREIVILFPHSWVLILQPDGTWETQRMD